MLASDSQLDRESKVTVDAIAQRLGLSARGTKQELVESIKRYLKTV